MTTNTDKKNKLTIASCAIALFFLASCSENDSDFIRHDGNNLNINLNLPDLLINTPPIPDLQAYVTLNGAKRTQLTVNPVDNTSSGSIANVTAGTYQLKLVYYKIIALEEIALATFTQTISVSAGQTTHVTVSNDKIDRNIDTDGDGYTNLAEVILGSDPRLKTDTPGIPIGFAVAHGSFAISTTSSGYSVSSIAGEALIGSNGSTNYQIVSGFTSY